MSRVVSTYSQQQVAWHVCIDLVYMHSTLPTACEYLLLTTTYYCFLRLQLLVRAVRGMEDADFALAVLGVRDDEGMRATLTLVALP